LTAPREARASSGMDRLPNVLVVWLDDSPLRGLVQRYSEEQKEAPPADMMGVGRCSVYASRSKTVAVGQIRGRIG